MANDTALAQGPLICTGYISYSLNTYVTLTV